MLILLIGIILGLIFTWILFFAGRVDPPAQAGEKTENENEETGSEPWEYEQKDETPPRVWDWEEEDDEDDEEEEEY